MRIAAGTRVILTGASRGIGRALAESLAARGARLGLIARGPEELRGLCEELGGRATALPADVADRGALDSAVQSFVEGAGGIDLAIANAGIARYAPFAEQDPEEVEAMVRTNVIGTINTARAALRPMLDRGSGHIVVLSSGAGLRAFPWAAVYGATKAADKGFAEALRHELSGTGVSVTTVFPGEVDTALHAEAEQLPDWRNSRDAIAPDQLRRDRAGAGRPGDDRRGRGRSPRAAHPPAGAPAGAERPRARTAGPPAGDGPRRLGGAEEILTAG